MNQVEIKKIAALGQDKVNNCFSYPWRYISRAAMAGAFIMTGVLISIVSASWFYLEQPGVAKLLGAATFSTALILIVLIGGELFTGTNFVLGISLLERKVRLGEVLHVWGVCFIGNFIGIFALALVVVGSGASGNLISDYLIDVVPAKLNCSWCALILKGIMCNFMVCIGVFAGIKLKSESGKCIVIIAVITTFVLLGFEHSIANMATFSLYVLMIPGADVLSIIWNLILVALGNVIGGAVLLGVPVWLSTEPEKMDMNLTSRIENG